LPRSQARALRTTTHVRSRSGHGDRSTYRRSRATPRPYIRPNV
jgi:hypothetical protein